MPTYHAFMSCCVPKVDLDFFLLCQIAHRYPLLDNGERALLHPKASFESSMKLL
jgi:hypothetical protein